MNATSLLAVTRLLASREFVGPVTVVSVHKRKSKPADKGFFCFKHCLGQEVKGKLSLYFSSFFSFIVCIACVSILTSEDKI